MVLMMSIEPDWLNMLTDRGGNKSYVIRADQVRLGSGIPGHGERKTEIAFHLLGQTGSDLKAYK